MPTMNHENAFSPHFHYGGEYMLSREIYTVIAFSFTFSFLLLCRASSLPPLLTVSSFPCIFVLDPFIFSLVWYFMSAVKSQPKPYSAYVMGRSEYLRHLNEFPCVFLRCFNLISLQIHHRMLIF